MLAYDILHCIGQSGLLGPGSPKRNKAKRRRIKMVMQELMYVAARVIRTARTIKLSLGRGCRLLIAFSCGIGSIANPPLNDDPGAIIAFPRETVG